VNIVKGTFRLSLLVGAAALGWFTWDASQSAHRVAAYHREIWETHRCAGKLLGQDVRQYQNAYGNLDLGKLGCSGREFWANMGEIEKAQHELNPYNETWWRYFRIDAQSAFWSALGLLVLTNLLGLAFLGARRAFRWVSDGYQQGK
jgi:hypothetical protein